MKISTKGRYGLEALLDIAIFGNGDSVSLKTISSRQGISQKYLEHIFIALKKKEIVISLRGGQGGYRISRPLNEVTIGEVLRALEGSLSPVKCISENTNGKCEFYDKCITKDVWVDIKTAVDDAVDSITLKDLVEEYSRLNDENVHNYIEYFI
ncbi:RrF2 family transcriptional regulator [Clostridium cylindrosporum]|uniref:HTH-type transcriptional regulator IscR n=1 Tax=Clostridium cylindrosporum DSM 605 TaxID=1121307 RepID=A0A0J8D523_CLOCY|nr:Rrf2 family transcriptional regulator [Clostridium cylindrosporum]KMT20917.1 HTH-type transcriptional regulator IscR [Clostridium cylindrosporum DSM 605]